MSKFLVIAYFLLSSFTVTSGSREEDFQEFYHTWAWRPSWSCNLDLLYKLSLPLPIEAAHEIGYDWQAVSEKKIFEKCG